MNKMKKVLASFTGDKKNKQKYNSSRTTEKVNSSESAAASPKEATDNIDPSHIRMVQNFHLVWLDKSINEITNEDCRNTITKLRQVVNTVNTFTNVDECIDFITDNTEEKVFMIISGALDETMATVVHEIVQVHVIYIFCETEARHEQWAAQWPIVKGVFMDNTPLCEALKQAAQECDQNSVSLSFVAPSSESPTQNLDQLDPTFMYTQILKEILFTIDFEPEHFVEYITYCRQHFAGNIAQLNNVDKLEREYYDHVPIWWYTYHSFLYSMLNRALRTMEFDLIIKMGFFVRDIHEHIARLHYEQYYAGRDQSTSFTVFRGQGLSPTDFSQLMKTKGGLMSFNNFLSTSFVRHVSLAFAESNANNPDLIGVFFQITIDPSIPSTPFANIRDVSYYQREEEILFSMHSIFRIGRIKQLNNNARLWQVDLTLTSDNDPQLHDLTNSIREETEGSTGWYRLGQLMIQLGHFNQAEDLYGIILAQEANQTKIKFIYNQLGWIKFNQGKYREAIAFYEKTLLIKQKTIAANHHDLSCSYNNIGMVYEKMGEYSEAISHHEKALKIVQKNLPANHHSLATCYNNIGLVYSNMGKYAKALSYHERTLEIFQKILPANHPTLSQLYSNIGLAYDDMGEYSKALSYYEKALEISQKTLPENHPILATTYNNIGGVYRNMAEYSKALSYHNKALEIHQRTLSGNHPDLGDSYNSIGLVYDYMEQYSEALSYYEKALQIREETLPENHPNLAASYNNIGGVYRNMIEYSKALSYHQKALKINQKSLPEYHPDLASVYHNIGGVYSKMGEYSNALSSHEKALKINQKSLPKKHPDFATSYNNIGGVYADMEEYSKAVSFFKRALDIGQRSLPENHPNLLASRNNIERVKNKM